MDIMLHPGMRSDYELMDDGYGKRRTKGQWKAKRMGEEKEEKVLTKATLALLYQIKEIASCHKLHHDDWNMISSTPHATRALTDRRRVMEDVKTPAMEACMSVYSAGTQGCKPASARVR